MTHLLDSYPHGKLIKAAIKVLEVPGDMCDAAIDYLLQQGQVISHMRDKDDDLTYLTVFYAVSLYWAAITRNLKV